MGELPGRTLQVLGVQQQKLSVPLEYLKSPTQRAELFRQPLALDLQQ